MMLRCAKKGKILAVLSLVASLACGRKVSAELLSVGDPGYGITITYNGNNIGTLAGNWTGTLGSQNLSYIYCVDLDGTINVPGSYNTTVTNDGTIFGNSVPNAGVVAALLDNYAAADVGPSMLDQSAAASSSHLEGDFWEQFHIQPQRSISCIPNGVQFVHLFC